VSHYYDEAFSYTGTRVIVAGAQNSAVETALDLYRHNVDVTMVCREPEIGQNVKYWIRPDLENRIKEGSIRAFFNTEIEEIFEKGCKVKNNQSGTKDELAADFFLLMTGYRPNESFIRSMGVDMDQETLVPVHNKETMETNRKGIYVAGSTVAGCKPSLVFIENGREHAKMIMKNISLEAVK
jgi:thioredoxin reductase (NADPH)